MAAAAPDALKSPQLAAVTCLYVSRNANIYGDGRLEVPDQHAEAGASVSQ